jgi:predicted ArsR family transcriptional regulator
MGQPTLSFEEVRQRNEEIVAYSSQHPEVTSTALAAKYGLSRESVRQILDRGRRQIERNQRLATKGVHWGFRGH